MNTRDEPHADVDLYRRMHVIVGDSNMAEVSTLVKVAATNLVLAAVESGERFSSALYLVVQRILEVAQGRSNRLSIGWQRFWCVLRY